MIIYSSVPFYIQLFLTIIILSLTIQIYLVNSIYSSLLLMLSIYIFFFPLFIFLNMDYIGIVLIMVYVGSVAILFIFVVMTVDTTDLKSNLIFIYLDNSLYKKKKIENLFTNDFFLAFSIFLLFLINQCLWIYSQASSYFLIFSEDKNVLFWMLQEPIKSNIEVVAFSLYDHYLNEVIVFSLILLVSIIGLTVLFFSYDPYLCEKKKLK